MRALKEAREAPSKIVLVFQDEASFYRQPSQGWLWSWMGRKQPKMRYSNRSNTHTRAVGFLDATTGRVLYWDMSRVSAKNLAQCIRRMSSSFPLAERIYLVWDNWPVHTHPIVQAALQKDIRIHVVELPSYAPWLNAIEKLWRLVRQEVAHAHPWCDDFHLYRAALAAKFDEFAFGSQRLLHYCGLSP
jgi:DDE superfamily endonuclease